MTTHPTGKDTQGHRSFKPGSGFLLVVAGAALWGTDALFRRGLALEIEAPKLVFLEHAVLVVLTLPLLLRGRQQIRALRPSGWLSAILIGVGSSALATILFTSAFRYGDPTTPLLLQKLQPLVAIAGATLILKERLLPRFAWFLLISLVGAFLIAFPDPTRVTVTALVPAMLALGAAALWGMGTVLGRFLSPSLSFQTMTALRFAIGLPAAGIIMGVVQESPLTFELSSRDFLAVIALALVPGLLALMIYYRGLRSTPASAATIAELAFPLTAAGLNYAVFDTPLSASQWAGAALLTATISIMSWLSRTRELREIGILSPDIKTPVPQG